MLGYMGAVFSLFQKSCLILSYNVIKSKRKMDSLNTHFYYNISIDLDPSHSTIICNFLLYIVQYTALEILAIMQAE